MSIPATNTSVNPARSTGPVLFVSGWALAVAFLVTPLIGGVIAEIGYRALAVEEGRA